MIYMFEEFVKKRFFNFGNLVTSSTKQKESQLHMASFSISLAHVQISLVICFSAKNLCFSYSFFTRNLSKSLLYKRS